MTAGEIDKELERLRDLKAPDYNQAEIALRINSLAIEKLALTLNRLADMQAIAIGMVEKAHPEACKHE